MPNYEIKQDNTKISKPIIPIKIKKKKVQYVPTKSYFLPDKRTSLLKKLDLEVTKRRNKEELYLRGVNNLQSFLTFISPSTYAGPLFRNNGKPYIDNVISGEGSGNTIGNIILDILPVGTIGGALGKKVIKKELIKDLLDNNINRIRIGDVLRNEYPNLPEGNYRFPDYAIPNSNKDALDLHADRLIKGGFDRLPSEVDGKTTLNGKKYKASSQFYNVHNYDKDYDDFVKSLSEDLNLDKNIPEELIHQGIRKVAEKESAFAIPSSGNIYIGKKGLERIFMDYGNLGKVISHEVDHALHIPYEKAKGFRFDQLSEDISDYFQKHNNTELAARGSLIKDYFGLDSPDLEITEDMLKYAAQNYIKDTGVDNNMKNFFNSISDWKEAAKWLSKHATIIGGLTYGTKQLHSKHK